MFDLPYYDYEVDKDVDNDDGPILPSDNQLVETLVYRIFL
jgi:hypothetical protein